MKYLVFISLSVIVVTSIVMAGVEAGEETQLLRWTIDGGGVTRSRGGDWELSGTVGQADAGVMEGNPYTLTGGFWFSVPPCDCDDDGGVTLYDYGDFESCASGPGGGIIAPSCRCFDMDNNGDVNLHDWSQLQQAFTGGNRSAICNGSLW